MKAIIFDLDGTLADTLPLYVKSYRFALSEQGFTYSDKEIVDLCFGKTELDICTRLGIPEMTPQFAKTYFEAVNTHFTQSTLFPGVIVGLKQAQEKGLKLSIISFAYNWYVKGMLKGLGIEEYFDVVLGYDDVHKPKPDPEAVFLVCHKLNINPQDALVIGDSKSDIMMGNAAQCTTVLFHPREHHLFYDLDTLKQANPTHVISTYKELTKLLI